MSLGLVWLRRDLRLHDHAALSLALEQCDRVQPIFIFDTDILAQFSNPQDRRLSFIAKTLVQLHVELQKRGGGLIVAHGCAEELVPQIAAALGASKIFAAKDHEPATRQRDRHVYETLKSQGRELVPAEDNFLIQPSDPALLNSQGEPYKVFTPFARHWRKTLLPNAFAEKVVKDNGRYADYHSNIKALQAAKLPLVLAEDAAAMLKQIGYNLVDLGEWQPQDAQKKLTQFARRKLKNYADSRNILADDEGTSHLSPYLRFGLVSVRECARVAVEIEGLEGTWMNELIWRDFYAMVLYRLPEFAKLEFYEKYRGLQWNTNEEHFTRWCEGKTGYPVVDAAMRQLVQTGWMHNRARMIVASFLTKHLLIDWRWGEAFFAQHLMDYELSSNVGGWQWAASTGIDPQPYFRIFNPTSQEKKFDPEQIYIKRYVAEYGTARYPAPMVKHDEARLRALAFYKKSIT